MKNKEDLAEKFRLNIQEEPDNSFKDDSLLNNSIGYQPPRGRFSSKSLSGITKGLIKRTKYDIKKRKQNLIKNKAENKTDNKKYLKIFNRKSFRNLNIV